jgi:hypothetical protein
MGPGSALHEGDDAYRRVADSEDSATAHHMLLFLEQLFYLARAQATRADPDATGLPLKADFHTLDVGGPPTIRHIMGMADRVPEDWGFRTDFAALCHGSLPPHEGASIASAAMAI